MRPSPDEIPPVIELVISPIFYSFIFALFFAFFCTLYLNEEVTRLPLFFPDHNRVPLYTSLMLTVDIPHPKRTGEQKLQIWVKSTSYATFLFACFYFFRFALPRYLKKIGPWRAKQEYLQCLQSVTAQRNDDAQWRKYMHEVMFPHLSELENKGEFRFPTEEDRKTMDPREFATRLYVARQIQWDPEQCKKQKYLEPLPKKRWFSFKRQP